MKEDGHQFSKTLDEHNVAVIAVRENQKKAEFFNEALIRFYFERRLTLSLYS